MVPPHTRPLFDFQHVLMYCELRASQDFTNTSIQPCVQVFLSCCRVVKVALTLVGRVLLLIIAWGYYSSTLAV